MNAEPPVKTTDALERALLGSLMIAGRPVVWGKVSSTVTAEHFSTEAHRLIFEAITEVAKTTDPDAVLVLAELDDRNRLERAGGAAYVTGLLDYPPDVENVVVYAKKVKERAIVRRVKATR